MIALNDAGLMNALSEQKDELLVKIARATDAEELESARDYLRFVSDLWKAVGYGYKVDEINIAIVKRAEHLVIVENEDLHQYRRGTHLWNVTKSSIKKLEQLAAI